MRGGWLALMVGPAVLLVVVLQVVSDAKDKYGPKIQLVTKVSQAGQQQQQETARAGAGLGEGRQGLVVRLCRISPFYGVGTVLTLAWLVWLWWWSVSRRRAPSRPRAPRP